MPTVSGENRVKLDSETMTIWDWWAASRSQIDHCGRRPRHLKVGEVARQSCASLQSLPGSNPNMPPPAFFFSFWETCHFLRVSQQIDMPQVLDYWCSMGHTDRPRDQGNSNALQRVCVWERESVKRHALVQEKYFQRRSKVIFRDGFKITTMSAIVKISDFQRRF
jgi:hypothetical protein